MPTFLKEVLKFDIESNGLWSSLPFAVLTLVNAISGIVSDKLIQSNFFTKNGVRKFFSVFGKINHEILVL